MDIYSKQTFLSEFQPKNLAKHLHKHEWIFAEYSEPAAERDDGKPYRAFLFRSEDRKTFGVKEFWGPVTTDFRQMASRVIADEVYRASLISDDEDLRKIWKRH